MLGRLDKGDAPAYLAALLATAALTTVALQLWKADLRVPLTYRGDALPVGAHFKTVIEEGWYEYQPRLGAPLGQTYNDFSTADNLHLVAAKILALFTSEWALAMNLYFLIGFLLIAAAGVWFLRKCGVSPWLSAALATLYSLAPYHFIRGESHLWLASYYTVPLALGLLVLVLRGEPLWGSDHSRSGLLRYALSPAARTIVIVALLATSSSYYSVFFLVLLAAAGIFTFLRDRSWRAFLGAGLAGFATVAVMLANMLPDLLFTAQNGANPLGVDRSGGEAEFYALKLAQLLLPWPGHRIGVLADLRQRYEAAYVSLGEQPALGIVGAIGLVVALLVVAYLAFARMRRTDAATPGGRFELIAALSGLVFVAFIFSTLGGLSTIISVFTSSLRGWNRMSIVIAMLCLAIVGLLIDSAIARLRTPARTRVIAAIAASAVLLGVGYFDQTPGNSDAEYAGNALAYREDQTYFAALEGRLPDQAMVLVLPYVPFPESSAVTGLLASEQLVPYLHTSTVRWSNGGIKGRPTADWPGQLAHYGDEHAAMLAVLAGFDGILVDRRAAADGGVALETALKPTDASPEVSPNGRFAFYDLASEAAALTERENSEQMAAAAALITNPVVAYRSPDFGLDSEGNLIVNAGSARFSLANATGEARRVRLSFTVPGAYAGGHLTVVFPDGSTIERALDSDETAVTRTLTVPAGIHFVLLSVIDANGAPVPELTIGMPVAWNTAVADLIDARPWR